MLLGGLEHEFSCMVNLWLIMVNNWNNNIVWLVVWNMFYCSIQLGINNTPN